MGNYRTTEGAHDPRGGKTDLARAHYTKGAARNIEAQQALERKIAFAHTGVGTVDFPIERQDQRHGMFRYGFRRIGRDPRDHDPALARGRQVDIVEAGAAERHQLDFVAAENGKRRLIEPVVHKRAYSVRSSREGCGIWPQPWFEIG
jgi:hypothetical protein